MTNSSKAKQLDFLSRLKPGEVTRVPVSEDEIGGELLNILSKGLYTNPLDAIREYVQNSIDANADQVEIQVTGNSVFILDYGDGMSDQELLQARDFGVSAKSIVENVGFRGIGIYSGFDLCERLIIRSKSILDDNEHLLEFHFGDMRRQLDAARQNPKRPIIPLTKLLEENTHYSYKKSSWQEKSFTQVQLEDLSDKHIHRLSDVKAMQQYILANLPIRFSEKFTHAEIIEKALSDNVRGYKSARVILRIEGVPTITVEKPNIPDLQVPEKGFLYSTSGKEIAYYWACLASVSDKISSDKFHNGRFKDFAGITYKIKGFTIGDRSVARNYMTQIPDWWTGEIYVIDPNIIPTSARDDFEAGPAKDALVTAVRELLNGPSNNTSFQKIAIKAQETRKADKAIAEIQVRVEKAQDKMDLGDFDQYKLYTELEDVLRILKRHKNKSSDKANAEKLTRKAKSLQRRAKKEIDEPTPISERKREAAKVAIQKAEVAQKEQDIEETSQQELEISDEAPPTPNETSETQSTENLLDAIERSGWSIVEEDIELINVIGEAIADNLGVNSQIYQRLIKDIEERLTELLEEI